MPTNKAGTNIGEAECGTVGNVCNLVYSAPSGAQFGDVLIADVVIGEISDINHLTLPSGWAAMPLSNQNNHYALISNDSNVDITSFLLIYVYGSQSGDTGNYTVGITVQHSNAEMSGFLVSYRGGNTDVSKYIAYGYYSTSDSTSFPAKAVSPSVNTTLLNLFSSYGGTDSEGSESGTFSKLTGNPPATLETPLGTFWPPYLAADVPVTISETYGPYTVTTATAINYSHQVVIPE